jgi:hypothetical protein
MNKLTHLSQKSIELVETIWVTFWARLLIVLLASLLTAWQVLARRSIPALAFCMKNPTTIESWLLRHTHLML